MVNAISTSLSGLMAQSKKLSVAANNIANASTTGPLDSTEAGRPYQAQEAVLTAGNGGGVDVTIRPRNNPTIPSYSPDSPDANEDGMVAAPNVNLDEELISSKMAEQAYAANAKVMSTINKMHDDLIRALDENA